MATLNKTLNVRIISEKMLTLTAAVAHRKLSNLKEFPAPLCARVVNRASIQCLHVCVQYLEQMCVF